MSDERPAGAPPPALLWGLALLMTVLWTLNPLAGKIALRHMPPFLLVAVRTAAAGLAILPVLLNTLRTARKPTWREWAMLGAFGFFLQIANQICFIYGLSRTSVAHTALIYALTPVVVLLIASAIGQEGFTARKLAGMAISVAGIALLSRDAEGGQATLFGDAVVFAAILLFSTFTVFGKEFRRRFGPVVMNGASYIAGGILLQPIVWGPYREVDLLALPFEAWAAVFYMAVFSAVIGYLIYYWALGHAPASRIATLQYLQPPLASALGWVVLGETVTWTLGAAGALILVGVFVTERG